MMINLFKTYSIFIKWVLTFCVIIGLFLLSENVFIYTFPVDVRYVICVLIFTVWLLLIELFPSTIVMLVVLLLLFLTPKVKFSIVLSGFSSDGFMLIFFSLFLISILRKTSIPTRIVYFIIQRSGDNHFKLLLSILVISQVMSFIIPSTAVRANILVDWTKNITAYFNDINDREYVNKIYFLTLTVGLNISSIVVITASVSNVITIEFLKIYTGEQISYFKWFILMAPLWISLVFLSWIFMAFLLNRKIPLYTKVSKLKTKRLSKVNVKEYWIIGSIAFAIFLWMFQGMHNLPLSFPLILVVIFLSVAKIIDWETINTIKVDLLLFVGVSLTLGKVIQEINVNQYFYDLIPQLYIEYILKSPIIAFTIIIIVIHFVHLFIPNIQTLTLIAIPLVIIFTQSHPNILLPSILVASVTCTFGFILSVQTISNLVVYTSTPYLTQKDFVLSGLILTIISSLLTLITSFLIWIPLV